MGAPLTIEQILQNHAVGVNLSDAESLSGHPLEDFSMVGHKHSADDITTGIMNPSRLPTGTTTGKGVVSLSSETDSDSQSLAATPYAVKAVKTLATGKADKSHTHGAGDITTGTFPALIAAASNKNYTTRQIRNIYLSTSAPSTNSGQDGDVWFQYE
ncbi:phage tail protein [Priestia megaterium]|uniref:phage tail protein n=1 Tax=Priestia megaterium TaxID=1404 RepID=UPI002E1DEB89|nr:phage tail protein [Priestia megaterium]